MRLLKRIDKGVYQLTKDLTGYEIPRYAILSHTWLPNNDLEVTFRDFTEGDPKSKPEGFAKLTFCGEQAARDGLEHFWVDTCCINKDSSTELQEAINTMFKWYHNSTRCYAYLGDVSIGYSGDGGADESPPSTLWESAFRDSRWFTRGWTLQELLAPTSVEFFSEDGTMLGDKASLKNMIHEITKIPIGALSGDDLDLFPVDERFSWAKRRQTKRDEDRAYCLFGLFNVFLPLIYGEGDLAYDRLRDEIEKRNARPIDFSKVLEKIPGVMGAAFNSLQNQHAPTCLPNTRTELLQYIEDWVEGSDERCIFWLNGIAGTGKSTVARTICRTYHDRQGPQKLGGSFFFSKGGGGLSKASNLAPTLARQLASRIPEAKRHICEGIMDQEDILDLCLSDQWDQLIIQPLSKLEATSATSTILLVIDALDECEGGKDIRGILRLLPTAKSLANIHLRIFITSRPQPGVRNEIQKIPLNEREFFMLHDIPQDLVDRDLNLFFEDRFSRLRNNGDFGAEWPGNHKVDRLVQTSSQLFVWAATACRFISAPRRRSVVERRIDRLINRLPPEESTENPESTLNSLYTTILKDFVKQLNSENEQEREESYMLLKKVLGSIVILGSPLSMGSLARLIDEDFHDVKYFLTELNTIFQIPGGDSGQTPSEDSRPVYLHHPTFRDFLLNKERQDEKFWVDEEKAHEAMGDHCLNLMSKHLRVDICGLKSPGQSSSDIQEDQIKRNIPVELEYACTHWVEHYCQSGVTLSDGDRVDQFFKEHFLHWLEVMNIMGKSAEQGVILRQYHARLHPRHNERQIPFVKDARRMIYNFQDIIKQSPLQVYCSALMFMPPTNELKSHFRQQRHQCIEDVKTNVPKDKDDFNYVCDVAFMPDSGTIISGSNFPAVRSWDVATKATLRKYEGAATDKMSAIAISPDGSTLAGGSDDFTVMVWKMKTGQLLHSFLAHDGWVNSVVFSPDGSMLASGSMDKTIALWDVKTGSLIERVDNHSSPVNSVTFSPNGAVIAAASEDALVRLWDFSKIDGSLMVQSTLDGHKSTVNCVRFSPNGKQIASGSNDSTVKISDTTETRSMTLKGHTNTVWAVAFSSNGRLLASGSEDQTVRLWDTISGATLSILKDHRNGINSVAFSPDDLLLASGYFDDEVRLWNTKNWAFFGKLDDFEEDVHSGVLATRRSYNPNPVGTDDRINFEPHLDTVTCVAISPNGNRLASGSLDATIKLWLGGHTHWTLGGHSNGITHLLFSPDSTTLASAAGDMTVRVWDSATGAARYVFEGHSEYLSSVLFSPNGQLLGSSAGDKTARLWDPINGQGLGKLEGHADVVNGLEFSPDNRSVVTWSEDTTAIIWDVSTRRRCATLQGHTNSINSVAFSTHGGQLVSCSEDATICTWNKDGSLCSQFACGTLPAKVAAFSPDNELLAICATDNIVKLCNPRNGSTLGSFDADIAVRRLCFSSCGRYIETDRGTLDIHSFSGVVSSAIFLHTSTNSHSIFATNDWLRLNMKNVVRLEKEYEAVVVDTFRNSILIGHASGAVSLIRFA